MKKYLSLPILEVLLFTYLILFPFGQLGKFEINSFSFQLIDLVTVLIGLVWLVGVFTKKYNFNKPFKFILLSFLAIAVFSYLLNIIKIDQSQALRGLFYLLRLGSFILLYFAASSYIATKEVNRNKVLNSLFWIGTYTTLFALIQYLLLPDMRALGYFDWDNHYFRAVGTFLDPGFLGLIICFYLLLLFGFIQEKKATSFKTIMFFLGIIVLALTFSRSGYLSFLAGILLMNFIKPKVGLTILTFAVLAGAILAIPKPGGEGVKLERTSTVVSRISGYQQAIIEGIKTPVFGQGYNLIQQDICNGSTSCNHANFGTDASFLFLFLTTGLVGVFNFAKLGVDIFLDVWEEKKLLINTIVLGSLVALLVNSFFQNSIFYPWVWGWMVILLALAKSENT